MNLEQAHEHLRKKVGDTPYSLQAYSRGGAPFYGCTIYVTPAVCVAGLKTPEDAVRVALDKMFSVECDDGSYAWVAIDLDANRAKILSTFPFDEPLVDGPPGTLGDGRE